jgi:hypothetical protein
MAFERGSPFGGVDMMMKKLLVLGLGLGVAGGLFATSVQADPPVCGRKACREEIALCVALECTFLRGHDLAFCRRECVSAVRDACEADVTVCNPVTTTTTTTSTTTTTTQYGSPSRAFLRPGDLLD